MKTRSQAVPIALNLVAACLGATAQYSYKIGAPKIGIVPIYRIGPIWLGALLFCTVTALFMTSFKLGGRLSVVYPVYATTFIWGMLIASRVGREPVNGLQIAGVVVIVLGVGLVAAGATA